MSVFAAISCHFRQCRWTALLSPCSLEGGVKRGWQVGESVKTRYMQSSANNDHEWITTMQKASYLELRLDSTSCNDSSLQARCMHNSDRTYFPAMVNSIAESPD